MRRPVVSGAPEPADADGLMSSPAAERNLGPILDAALPYLPSSGTVLEIASGTGQHVAAFAAHRPDLSFRPSDVDPARRAATDARCRGLSNVAASVALDAGAPGWAALHGPVDGLIVVNLLHLITDGAMAVLLDEAARALWPDGRLVIYGPFLRDGVATSEGDARFDADLRAQDLGVGYKDIAVVETVLGVLDLAPRIVEMPANNLMVLCRKGAPGL